MSCVLSFMRLVGEGDGGMLGFFGGARPRIEHVGEFGVSVRKDYWGLRIGGLLVDALIAWATASPVVTKINLKVRTDNARAIHLYETKGFVIEGTVRDDMRSAALATMSSSTSGGHGSS